MSHHAQLIFVSLVEMGFCYVGQAGLKLLTSGDPSALGSQSARITGVSHRTWPARNIYNFEMCMKIVDFVMQFKFNTFLWVIILVIFLLINCAIK